jgi:hypothetical protein
VSLRLRKGLETTLFAFPAMTDFIDSRYSFLPLPKCDRWWGRAEQAKNRGSVGRCISGQSSWLTLALDRRLSGG